MNQDSFATEYEDNAGDIFYRFAPFIQDFIYLLRNIGTIYLNIGAF